MYEQKIGYRKESKYIRYHRLVRKRINASSFSLHRITVIMVYSLRFSTKNLRYWKVYRINNFSGGIFSTFFNFSNW